MKSEKEILEALHTLQDVCIDNEGKCQICMLRNGDNDCGVVVNSMGDTHSKLSDWDIKDLEYPRLILN